MKDLGLVMKILGRRINKERLLKVSQANYVKKVLKKFNIADAKPMNVSLIGDFKLSEAHTLMTEDKKTLMSKVPYASAVGSLIYAMV